MTWLEILIKAASILFGITVACIITIPKLKKAIKSRNEAKSAEEKAVADAAIKDAILGFVPITEEKFSTLNTALKNMTGSGAGVYKKDHIMTLIRDFCDENGYEYNKDNISSYVDKVVGIMNINKK